MSAVATNGNGQIKKRERTNVDVLADKIAGMGAEIARALPKHVSADRMARIATTALRTTRQLGDATPVSFLGCMMQLAQLGLEPNTPLGHAYLIPRKNGKSGEMECTLILGYQGMLDIARRSGLVQNVWAHAVYRGDEFSAQYGTEPKIVHVPSYDGPRTHKELTHVYACALIKGSSMPTQVVLSKTEVEGYRMRGASPRAKTPWDTDYEAMAIKTAIRRLFRFLPKSAEMAVAAAVDDAPSPVSAFSSEVRDVLTSSGYSLEEGEVVDEYGEVLTTTEREPGAEG
jgi:recombination protein RecT